MTERACEACGAALQGRRAQVRYCDQACRQQGARDRRAAASLAPNRDVVSEQAVTVSGGSGVDGRASAEHSGAAPPRHSWPELVVAAFRDDEELAEHAPVWEEHFRRRGELR